MNVTTTRASIRDIRLFNEATGRDVTTEASGSMTPEKARRVALLGVDFVSVGAITHSARAIDIALEVTVPTLAKPRTNTESTVVR
jgi:nicotinate-nucleotide pyrophosphorylase (carboxylating)